MSGAGPGAGFTLDAVAVRRAFERASVSYDNCSVLQADVRAQLLARLDLTTLEPRLVLDAGAGTGHASRALQRRYRSARVVAVDFSPAMLRVAGAQRTWLRPFDRVCADAGRLPFADGSIDLVFSNFLVHWCDPRTLFGEFRRVLAPRGLVTFSCLGVDTLRELREAWAGVDTEPRVHLFHDMHTLGDELVRAGLAAPVLDVERYTLHYADLAALAADLRGAGARNATVGRPKGLTGKNKLAQLKAAYEVHRKQGRLPATFEIVYGQAWAPLASAAAGPGAAAKAGISLAALRAQLPGKGRR